MNAKISVFVICVEAIYICYMICMIVLLSATFIGADTTRQRQRTHFVVFLLYLEILSLNVSKNVRYYWKSSLRGRRNRAFKFVSWRNQITHINSFVRMNHLNSCVIWICFFKVGAACYKSKYVKIKWQIVKHWSRKTCKYQLKFRIVLPIG